MKKLSLFYTWPRQYVYISWQGNQKADELQWDILLLKYNNKK